MSSVNHTDKYIGDWSSGMIGVSKTFGGSSILSSPAPNLVKERLFVCLLEKLTQKLTRRKKAMLCVQNNLYSYHCFFNEKVCVFLIRNI